MDGDDDLQSELFYADTDREPGDRNVNKFGLIVHPPVFVISVVLILLFMGLTLAFQTPAARVFGEGQAAIATGLPFAAVLVCMCGTILMGLNREYSILQSEECTERLDDDAVADVPAGVPTDDD